MTMTIVTLAVMSLTPQSLSVAARPSAHAIDALPTTLGRSLRHPVFQQATIEPPSAWVSVARLQPDERVIVDTVALGALSGRVVTADADRLVLMIDGETAPRSVPRDQVERVSIRSRARGSKVGAIVGAGVGAFVGTLFAINLAYKDCGGDCSDEKVLIGLSLLAVPVGSAFVGYRTFPRPEHVTVIYQRTHPSGLTLLNRRIRLP